MKALYFSEHGTVDNLRYGDVAEPVLEPHQALLEVKACAMNHLDLWVLRGWRGLRLSMPHIGGADVAGVIQEVGQNVSGWKKGTRVVVDPGIVTGEDEWTIKGEDSLSPHYRLLGESCQGGFAEFVVVPAQNMVALPDHLDFVSACAPLLVGTTSWRMLKARARLQPGETVLIIGAGGGVNSFSIQLSKFVGAQVIALTSSAQKAEKAHALGADHVIDYTKFPEWSREVKNLTKNRGVDVVVDNVGAKTFPESLRAVCRGGRIVTVGNTSGPSIAIDNRLVFGKQVSILGSTMGSHQDFLDMLEVVWSGKIQPVVDKVLPLEDGKVAYQILEEGSQFGKVVLT